MSCSRRNRCNCNPRCHSICGGNPRSRLAVTLKEPSALDLLYLRALPEHQVTCFELWTFKGRSYRNYCCVWRNACVSNFASDLYIACSRAVTSGWQLDGRDCSFTPQVATATDNSDATFGATSFRLPPPLSGSLIEEFNDAMQKTQPELTAFRTIPDYLSPSESVTASDSTTPYPKTNVGQSSSAGDARRDSIMQIDSCDPCCAVSLWAISGVLLKRGLKYFSGSTHR